MTPPTNTTGDLIRLGALARRLGVSLRTVHRWRISGVGGRRLSCVRYGGTWYTTGAAIAAFRVVSISTPGERPPEPTADIDQELAAARAAGWA